MGFSILAKAKLDEIPNEVTLRNDVLPIIIRIFEINHEDTNKHILVFTHMSPWSRLNLLTPQFYRNMFDFLPSAAEH